MTAAREYMLGARRYIGRAMSVAVLSDWWHAEAEKRRKARLTQDEVNALRDALLKRRDQLEAGQ